MNARALFVFALLSHGLWGLAMTASEPRAFAVYVTPNDDSQLPFFPLRDYRLTWQLVGAENRALASGSVAVEGWKPRSVSQTVPAREKPQPISLVVKLLRPDGSIAMQRSLASN